MQTSSRQPYLDWLRIGAIVSVLVFHSAQPFAAGEQWHISNVQRSELLTEFGFWLGRFRMHLLFFISGAVSYYMLRKYNGRHFISQRFQRLMIPLLFGMLVVVPPQIYMERLNQGYTGSYREFYPSVFAFKPYPAGNISWHHLWFILYLFIYDIISVPLFKWLLFGKGRAWSERWLAWLARGRRIYLLMIPGIIVYATLTLRFPRSNGLWNDWAMLLYWYLYVITGYLVMCHVSLIDSFVRNRRTSMLLAFLSLLLVNYFRWNKMEPPIMPGGAWRQSPWTYAYLGVYPVIAWSWIMMLTGYAKRYFNRPHRFLSYANPAIYPFYILHQTVIVIIAYYVVKVDEPVLSKYLFILFSTFMVCIFCYHLFIRPYNAMRVLFGMKPLKRTGKSGAGRGMVDETGAELKIA